MASPLRQFWARCLYQWGSAHRYFGVAHGVTREFRRAAHYFGRAYEIDPSFQQARLDWAIVVGRELGEPKKAVGELDQLALTFKEKLREIVLNRAQLRQELGDYRGALVDWKSYLRTADHNDPYRPLAQRTEKYLQELIAGEAEGGASPID